MSTNTHAPRCNRTAFVVLAVLLGALGVHNFVAGYAKKGIAQLLISLLGSLVVVGPLVSWFWAIFDAFTVRTDANGIAFDQPAGPADPDADDRREDEFGPVPTPRPSQEDTFDRAA